MIGALALVLSFPCSMAHKRVQLDVCNHDPYGMGFSVANGTCTLYFRQIVGTVDDACVPRLYNGWLVVRFACEELLGNEPWPLAQGPSLNIWADISELAQTADVVNSSHQMCMFTTLHPVVASHRMPFFTENGYDVEGIECLDQQALDEDESIIDAMTYGLWLQPVQGSDECRLAVMYDSKGRNYRSKLTFACKPRLYSSPAHVPSTLRTGCCASPL